jgi:hypothetical protein
MFAAEVDRNAPLSIIFEHDDELETGPQGFEVLAQSSHADVFGMLKFGDRPLGASRRPANSTWLIASPCRSS